MQSLPQSIPAGALVTVPEPSPAFVKVTFAVSKVAVTAAAAFIVTTQLPAPVQAPDQPAKTALGAGVAVRVTTVPSSNSAEHSNAMSEQLIPAGSLITEPDPSPASTTSRPNVTNAEAGRGPNKLETQ